MSRMTETNYVYDSEIHRWTEPEQVDDLRQRLGNAASDLSNNDLAEMILRRSNLVCATIGGVAQLPSNQRCTKKPTSTSEGII